LRIYLYEIFDHVTENLNVEYDIFETESTVRSLDSDGVSSDEDEP
jgi:hypothetical protein